MDSYRIGKGQLSGKKIRLFWWRDRNCLTVNVSLPEEYRSEAVKKVGCPVRQDSPTLVRGRAAEERRTNYRQRTIKNQNLSHLLHFRHGVMIARRARSLKLGNLSACRMPCGASTYESLDVSEWMLFEETATGCMCSEFALQ